MKDCSLPILGDIFFIVLILWGSFFTLNLLLAVLEGNFTKGKEDDKVRALNRTDLANEKLRPGVYILFFCPLLFFFSPVHTGIASILP